MTVPGALPPAPAKGIYPFGIPDLGYDYSVGCLKGCYKMEICGLLCNLLVLTICIFLILLFLFVKVYLSIYTHNPKVL